MSHVLKQPGSYTHPLASQISTLNLRTETCSLEIRVYETLKPVSMWIGYYSCFILCAVAGAAATGPSWSCGGTKL